MLKWFGYDKNEVLEFNGKRICGLWFLIIGVTIVLATAFGGDMMVNPFILGIGYVVGMGVSFNPIVAKKLSLGSSSSFQNKMATVAIVAMFVLMLFIVGPFFSSENFRMIWLGALLAVGLHFFIFYFVHGKSMVYIGVLCSLCAVLGMILTDVPFAFFGVADGVIKVSFGAYLLFCSKPTTSRAV